jgi:hypothetical protein
MLLEQLFTPELSRKLSADPTLLAGRDAVVLVLFCDRWGFSRISQRMEAAVPFEWIVLRCLAKRAADRSGSAAELLDDLRGLTARGAEFFGARMARPNSSTSVPRAVPRGRGVSTPRTPIFFSDCSPDRTIAQGSPKAFGSGRPGSNEPIRILDTELGLITGTLPEGEEVPNAYDAVANPATVSGLPTSISRLRYYQLAHNYA